MRIARKRSLIHFIDLIRVEKLFGVSQIHFFADEYIEQVWIDMPVNFECPEYLQGFGQRLALLVWPVLGSERFEYVRDSHYPGRHGHSITRKSAWITLAIHALVMTTGIFRNVFQVSGPRQ